MGNGIDDSQPPHGAPVPEPADDEENEDAVATPTESDAGDEEE